MDFQFLLKSILRKDGHLDDLDTMEDRWKSVTSHYQTEELTFEEFIIFDNDVAVTGILSESDIIASLNHNNNEENSDDDDINDPRDNKTCTMKETKNAIILLRSFFENKADIDDIIFNTLTKIENAVDFQAVKVIKQNKITDFFTK